MATERDEDKRRCHVKGRHIVCKDYRHIEYDARGIALCEVCDRCETEKLSMYRPEVLTDPNYDTMGETLYEDDY